MKAGSEAENGDTRLIERWLPIAEIGIESERERGSMTALPPTYYLHVWWARRPLVASRAAILASLLPEDADRDKFMHMIGIHGDPVAARKKIDEAKKTGTRIPNPYVHPRAFNYLPDRSDRDWMAARCGELQSLQLLDPTAGGGQIPFEARRLGMVATANDLNPVAVFIMSATIDWPVKHGTAVLDEFDHLGTEFRRKIGRRLMDLFPADPSGTSVLGDGIGDQRYDLTYLWAHTVNCPYCNGLVPLSPNWRLASDGTGVRLLPQTVDGPFAEGRVCRFKVVRRRSEHSGPTVQRGTGRCPYPDCKRIIVGDEIKRQAKSGRMGNQLYAVVYKKRVPVVLKSGKPGKDKWKQCYRAPLPRDAHDKFVAERLAKKLPEWEALDIVPSEIIPDGNKTTEPQNYGMFLWRDMFSSRQLLCHGTGAEVFREMLDGDRAADRLDEVRRAAYGYLAIVLDKMLDYNSRLCVWDSHRGRVCHTFALHAFPFKWSYAEMAPLVVGLGYDWAVRQTTKALRELLALSHPQNPSQSGLFDENREKADGPPVTITCKSADSLDHIGTGTVDAVVIDPPYYDNVMYAELSDFFYVWLKRTAGYVFPELFRRQLTDKENEAVANPSRFKDKDRKERKALVARDYQERMAAVFAECHRVLKPDGIMTLMFTHKAIGAWDALTTGLIEAGFMITASWPILTEAPGSLHIKDKAAARSTVFLACRPRAKAADSAKETYWEDVEPKVARAVTRRVKEFQDVGLSGVDLYLASFGPALEEFSRHWPLRRGTPRRPPATKRGRGRTGLVAPDPYAVTPEDALDAARREVKKWRLEKLTRMKTSPDLDPPTAFFVLSWDAFAAPSFPYDEALKLARAVGTRLESDIIGRLGAKQGEYLVLWDSSKRAKRGVLGPSDGSNSMIDAIHGLAYVAREHSLEAARESMAGQSLDKEPRFTTALTALLEVLPVSKKFTGFALPKALTEASGDFEALYYLNRLAYGNEAKEPEQLKLWQDL